MAPWIIWLIAAASTAVCLFVWFRDVRRIMRDRLNTVESSAAQLAACQEKALKERGTEAAEILARSEKIYRQAVELYNQAMRKPWIYLPAVLMKFKPVL